MNEEDIKIKFEEIYEQKIKPKLNNLENHRLEEKKKYDFWNKIFILLWVLSLIDFIIIWQTSNLIFVGVFCILIILGFVFGGKSTKISDNFRKTIKPSLLKPILNIFGKFYLLDKESMTLKDIKSMGLYHKATKKIDDDIIVGTYKDIPISLIETKLTHTQSNGKSSSTVTDFNGLILKIKMNKNFEGITIGEQKVDINNYIKLLKEVPRRNPELYPPEKLKWLDSPIFNAIGQTQKFMSDNKLFLKNGKLYIDIFDKLTKNKVTRKLEKISLEDSEFNNNYNIYSDNQIESRYLLTPSFIQRIKEIQSIFLVASVDFVFKEEFLYLFLNGSSIVTETVTTQNQNSQLGNGFFEVGNIETTILNKQIYLKLFKELISIFSLVNYFKIDEKTGL